MKEPWKARAIQAMDGSETSGVSGTPEACALLLAGLLGGLRNDPDIAVFDVYKVI
jgi:hypothetical protein